MGAVKEGTGRIQGEVQALFAALGWSGGQCLSLHVSRWSGLPAWVSVGSSIMAIPVLLACLEPTWGTTSVCHRHKDVGLALPPKGIFSLWECSMNHVSGMSFWLMRRLYKQASCCEEATATQLPILVFINTKIGNGKKNRNKQAGCFWLGAALLQSALKALMFV